MKESLPKILIILPAYNESAVIGGVVLELISELKKNKIIADVLVVNDCSTDDTADVAKRNGAIVINHIINQGAGGATSTGLAYAQKKHFDIAVTMDADGQHTSKDVINGIKKIKKNKCDLLIGSRLIDSKGMSKVKILGNKGLSLITQILFGVNVTDSQSGLRVFSKKALHELEWKSTGYEFCSEMLWRAKQSNLSISEYPISAIYTEYSKGKGQNNWNAVNIIKSLIKQRITEMFE